MAKIRNSLGVLVLPVPVGEMTWEQYKDKYGIDLASSLGLKNGYLHFPRKIIYLDDIENNYFMIPLHPVFAATNSAILDDQQQNIGIEYLFPYIEYAQSLKVIGHMSLKIYDDPDTPNTIVYTEI